MRLFTAPSATLIPLSIRLLAGAPATLATAITAFAAFELSATAFFTRRLFRFFPGKMLKPVFLSLSLRPSRQEEFLQIQVCF